MHTTNWSSSFCPDSQVRRSIELNREETYIRLSKKETLITVNGTATVFQVDIFHVMFDAEKWRWINFSSSCLSGEMELVERSWRSCIMLINNPPQVIEGSPTYKEVRKHFMSKLIFWVPYSTLPMFETSISLGYNHEEKEKPKASCSIFFVTQIHTLKLRQTLKGWPDV